MIANRVRELREALEISQRELARRLHVRQATLSRIENGTPQRLDFRILERLCHIFNCQPGELLYYRADRPRRTR